MKIDAHVIKKDLTSEINELTKKIERMYKRYNEIPVLMSVSNTTDDDIDVPDGMQAITIKHPIYSQAAIFNTMKKELGKQYWISWRQNSFKVGYFPKTIKQ